MCEMVPSHVLRSANLRQVVDRNGFASFDDLSDCAGGHMNLPFVSSNCYVLRWNKEDASFIEIEERSTATNVAGVCRKQQPIGIDGVSPVPVLVMVPVPVPLISAVLAT